MKVNTKYEVKDIFGDLIITPKGEPATLGWCIIEALLYPEAGREAKEHIERYELAKKVLLQEEVDLTTEQTNKIRFGLAARFPSTSVVGAVSDLLGE